MHPAHWTQLCIFVIHTPQNQHWIHFSLVLTKCSVFTHISDHSRVPYSLISDFCFLSTGPTGSSWSPGSLRKTRRGCKYASWVTCLHCFFLIAFRIKECVWTLIKSPTEHRHRFCELSLLCVFPVLPSPAVLLIRLHSFHFSCPHHTDPHTPHRKISAY